METNIEVLRKSRIREKVLQVNTAHSVKLKEAGFQLWILAPEPRTVSLLWNLHWGRYTEPGRVSWSCPFHCNYHFFFHFPNILEYLHTALQSPEKWHHMSAPVVSPWESFFFSLSCNLPPLWAQHGVWPSGDLSNLGWVSATSPTFWVSGCDTIPWGEFDILICLRVSTLHGSTFTLQDRVQEDVNFGTSYSKVMLETCRVLVSLGDCSPLFCARALLPCVILLSVSRVALWDTDAHHVFPAALTTFWTQVIFCSLSAPRTLCLYTFIYM